MKSLKHSCNFFVLSLFCSIILFSCRKKDERYEGYYVGTETNTKLDSGATTVAFDTTYSQHYDVTYAKKVYSFVKGINPSNEIFTQESSSIINHEVKEQGELYYDSQGNYVGGYGSLRFSGDSLFINHTSYWNGDSESWNFKGKRK